MESRTSIHILKPLILFLFVFTIFSCKTNNEIPVNLDNLLLGNWEYVSYNNSDTSTTLKRVANLPENKGGISFKLGDVFIERSSGFCGTPPISFHNYEGTWQQDEDIINTTNFQGDFQWKILSLTTNKLIIKLL